MLLLIFAGNTITAQAQDTIANPNNTNPGIRVHLYDKPKPFSFLTHVPNDVWGFTKAPFEKNGWKGFLGVAVTSAILIHYDQQLLDGTTHFGRDIHLQPQTDYKVLITIKNSSGGIKIFKVPKNLNSAFYTFGEGWIGLALAGEFWTQGKLSHNYRSLQTASDLIEEFTSAAVMTQFIKHTTGRESPFMRTELGGKWTAFPSFSDFKKNTSAFNAFPSGHLATMMINVTILAENYPENKWIKPVGYTLMGLTSFALMNTEVHRAGDYPLALAIGYLNGRIISA